MSWFQDALQFAKGIFVEEGKDFIVRPVTTGAGETVEKEKDYVTISVKASRIVDVRRWTTKFYGCVQSRAHYYHMARGDDVEYQTVLVPAKMRELDPDNLDAVISINKPVL